MLEPKDFFTVSLGNSHNADLSGKQGLRDSFGDGVEKVINGPIEHFNEKRVFPQDPAVDVICPARRVGRLNRDSAEGFGFQWIWRWVACIIGDGYIVLVGRFVVLPAEYAVVFASVEKQ